MAGMCGLFLSPIYYVHPNAGAPFGAIPMIIMVLGGLGNVGGSVVCGMLGGILEAILGAYISPDIAPVGIFILLIVVLIFKPDGLFGKGVRKA